MDMQTITLTPERMAQLQSYAQRRGKDAAAALDDVLADYLRAEQQEYDETVRAALEAHEQVKAGQTRPAENFLEEVRVKYGFPR